MPMEPDFLTLTQFAERAQLSLPTLRKAVDAGIVPTIRFGRRAIRIPAAALEQLARDAMAQRGPHNEATNTD